MRLFPTPYVLPNPSNRPGRVEKSPYEIAAKRLEIDENVYSALWGKAEATFDNIKRMTTLAGCEVTYAFAKAPKWVNPNMCSRPRPDHHFGYDLV